MHIIVINGPPRAGKDIFVGFCLGEFAQRGIIGTCVSSVDRVKQAARLLGWDGEKTSTGRQFLSDLKDLSTRIYDGPMRYMQSMIEESDGAGVMFFMIREPEEIGNFVAEYPDAVTVLVSSPGADTTPDNHADRNVLDYQYNWYIDNYGTLGDLRGTARSFVASVVAS